MIAATDPAIIEGISSVLDVHRALKSEVYQHNHTPDQRSIKTKISDSDEVREQLEDLGYM
jgi:hypothetical protein